VLYDDKYFDAKWNKIIPFLPKGGDYRYDLRSYGYQIIIDHIGPNKRVFDFACGLSIIGTKLARNGCFVSGCDISPVAVQWCKEKVSSDYRIGEDVFGGPYDYVVATYFLEHIPDPVFWIKKALRVAPAIICSLPNNFSRTGEHSLMAWNSWETFNKLFNCFEVERIDDGKYPPKLCGAYKHPTIEFREVV